MDRKNRKAASVLALSLSMMFLLSGCTAQESAPVESAAPLTAVETVKVNAETIKREMVYAGQVTPLESVSVVSRVTGKVLEYYFDVGDSVKAGDVLFKLSEEDIQDQITQISAQLRQAEQSVRTAQNGLSSVTGGQYRSGVLQQESAIEALDTQLLNADINIQNAETAVGNAEKSLNITRENYDDTKALFESQAVSQAAFDEVELRLTQAQAAFDSAKAALEQAVNGKSQLLTQKTTAQESLDLTKGQITDDNTRQAQLGIDTARAARDTLSVSLQLAHDTLQDTAVTSPIDGVISARTAVAGEYVNPQLPAFTVIDMNKVYVDVNISELLINAIYPGGTVDVAINALSGAELKGTIKTISPAAGQAGTFPVKIELDNSDNIIKPGMFAEVKFIRDMSENTVVLARNTVLDDDEGSFVFINSGGTAVKTMVETGIDNGESIEILSGLNVGDEVIIKGHTFISDGEQVNVVNAQ